jgi:hypothetical protein
VGLISNSQVELDWPETAQHCSIYQQPAAHHVSLFMVAPIQIPSFIAALGFSVHAAFSPYYETGLGMYFAPAYFSMVAYVFSAFIFRKVWTWPWMGTITVFFVVINAIFPPMPEHFGALTAFARILITTECIACIVIFCLMRQTKTKTWFFEKPRS